MSLLAQLIETAQLGSRISYDSYQNWLSDLPKRRDLVKSAAGTIERAQCIGKDFEGVAGTFDKVSGKGWIYAYYLKKENVRESAMSDLSQFCDEVEELVKKQYGHDDGGDLQPG